METPTRSDNRPVFFDPTRQRGIRVQRAVAAVIFLTAVVFLIFWVSVIAVPVTKRLLVMPPRFMPDTALRTVAGIKGHQTTRPITAADVAAERQAVLEQRRLARHAKAELRRSSVSISGKGNDIVGGFYVSWDSASLASLKQHAAEMTHLFPGWLHLNEDGGRLVPKDSDPSDWEALQVARQNHLMIVPLLNNFSDSLQEFDDDRLHKMLISPPKRAAIVAQVKAYLLKQHYGGINIDLESDDEQDRALLPSLAAEFSAALHPLGLLVTEDTQAGDPVRSADIARSCDFVIPMIYDEHWANGGMPGPIASQVWANNELDAFLESVPASKTVLAIGNYAYNWIDKQPGAQSLTFSEAMATASESLDGEDGVVHFDQASQNPYFGYTEDDGKRHVVWFLDSATAFNSMKYAATRGVRGRALWYVGSEDPTIWSFFGRGKQVRTLPDISTVRYGFEIDFEGEGEILDIAAHPQAGHRDVTVRPDGYVSNEEFTSYPTVYIVRRTGQHRDAHGRLEKKLALTFDDGPDPRWTPQLLDILAKNNVPATFFVIGTNAQKRPDLLEREWDAGDEIGNHTFYHPNMSQATDARMRLEIDATQRTIQSAIGRSTTLFRPPFGIDVQPSTSDELRPVDVAQSKGYVTVGEGIDPRDWETGANKQTADQLAASIIDGAEKSEGNVVLLHDGGGDREQTLTAVALAIPRLKAEGFRFVTVTKLIGDKPRDSYFPAVAGRQRVLMYVDRQVFRFLSVGGQILVTLFLFTLIAGTLRLIAVAILAVLHAKREARFETVDERNRTILAQISKHSGGAIAAIPSVSVVVAAYNESKVIARTVTALLDGGYPNLEVVVVDDGSTDGTGEIAEIAFASDSRVRVVRRENGGKAAALNAGIAVSSGAILIGLDADTLFAPDTVQRLARHFVDPAVGAVAGNVQVGNRRNILTRWQSVEYITSQNFDRRAYEMMNAIPVIPGAVSAWRATAVRDAGGYSTDTLAEDADLTWRVRRNGWKLLTDSTALAFTEAPERMRDLIKQRFRWTFGTLQTLWKHRDLVFRADQGAFGCLVAPSLWIFQIILPLALPFADLGLVFAALMGNLTVAMGYFVFFFLIEFGAACLAFRLDRTPTYKRRDLAWLPVQRFVFRYILFFVLIRSLATAVRGSRTGWNKLERRGTAHVGVGH